MLVLTVLLSLLWWLKKTGVITVPQRVVSLLLLALLFGVVLVAFGLRIHRAPSKHTIF